MSNYIEHSDPTLFAKYAGPRALDETSIGDIPLHEQQAYWASLGESGEMTDDDANRLYAAWHAAQVSFSGLSAPLEQREVSNYTDPNEFLLSEYSKYAERIAEGDPMEFDDWLAGSDLPEIVKAREIAKVQERNLSNYIEHPASGKTGTFTAKYDQHAERNGQTFTVLGAVDPKTYDATECGEMFSIRFADGVQIDAWPEEVESAMNEARLVNIDEEVVVKLADGCTLRSGVYDPHKEGALTSGEYVRLCDPDGEEILYWDQEEWANDPALVMGAIMNAAAGLRVHHVDSPSPGM